MQNGFHHMCVSIYVSLDEAEHGFSIIFGNILGLIFVRDLAELDLAFFLNLDLTMSLALKFRTVFLIITICFAIIYCAFILHEIFLVRANW